MGWVYMLWVRGGNLLREVKLGKGAVIDKQLRSARYGE